MSTNRMVSSCWCRSSSSSSRARSRMSSSSRFEGSFAIRLADLPRRVQPDADLEAAAVVAVVVVVDAEKEPALALDGEVGALAYKKRQHGAARPHLADEGAAALVVHRQLPDQVGPVALAAPGSAGLGGGVVDGALGEDADDVAFFEVNAGVHPLLVGGDLEVLAQRAPRGGRGARAGSGGRRGAGRGGGGRAHRGLDARGVGAAGAFER